MTVHIDDKFLGTTTIRFSYAFLCLDRTSNIDTVLDATVALTKGVHQIKIRAVNDPYGGTTYSLVLLVIEHRPTTRSDAVVWSDYYSMQLPAHYSSKPMTRGFGWRATQDYAYACDARAVYLTRKEKLNNERHYVTRSSEDVATADGQCNHMCIVLHCMSRVRGVQDYQQRYVQILLPSHQ